MTAADPPVTYGASTHGLRGDYADMRPDYTVSQVYSRYRDTDQDRWRRLYARQMRLVPGRACPEFLRVVGTLGYEAGIPRFDEVNERLDRATGWRVVAVPGLLPEHVFFTHLAHRRFPVTVWLREEHEFDYIVEPDVFHDFFGHVPLLFDPVFADYMQAYGRGGQKAEGLHALEYLARLYWYTVEFGLVRGTDGLRIYGAGILSSPSEVTYALSSPLPGARLHAPLRRDRRPGPIPGRRRAAAGPTVRTRRGLTMSRPSPVVADAAAPFKLGHFVDGRHVAGTAGREGPVYNPATGALRGHVAFATADDTRAAIAAAEAALPGWAGVTPLQRARVMFRFKALLEQHADAIALTLTSEHGKVLSDARGEITRGIEVVEFACGIPQLLKSEFTENVGTGVDSWSIRQPVGVCAGITPFTASPWACAPASRRSTSRRWCRCGCSRWRSPAATPSCSSRRRRTRACRCASRSCSRRRGCRTACSTS